MHIACTERTPMFPRTFKEVFVRAVASRYGSPLIEFAIAEYNYVAPPTHPLELEFYKFSGSTIDDIIPTIEVPRVKFVKFISSGLVSSHRSVIYEISSPKRRSTVRI